MSAPAVPTELVEFFVPVSDWIAEVESAPEARGYAYHDSKLNRGIEVRLTNSEDWTRLFKLSVECVTGGWRNSFIEWIVPPRKAVESEGGEALQEQERVATSPNIAYALLGPGTAEEPQTRSISFNIRPFLAKDILPGLKNLEVVCTDAATGEPVGRHQILLDIRFPNSSLASYLPGIYREIDPPTGEKSFFTRMLLGFDEEFDGLKVICDRLFETFGYDTAPSDFLDWLAWWVVMPLDATWTEMKRRKLIKEAFDLHLIRGTKEGLSRIIEIYSGVKPQIHDQPVKGMRLGASAKLATPGARLGDLKPFEFVVTLALPRGHACSEDTIHEIILMNKPAHTAYSLKVVESLPGDIRSQRGS